MRMEQELRLFKDLWMPVWCVLVTYIYTLIKRLPRCTYIQGPNEKGKKCATCGEDTQKCVGHYGYIKLVLPVFHIGYFRPTINMLSCICKVRPLAYSLSPITNDCYRLVLVSFYQRQNALPSLNVFVALTSNLFNVNLLPKLSSQPVRSKIYVRTAVPPTVSSRSPVPLGFRTNPTERPRWQV